MPPEGFRILAFSVSPLPAVPIPDSVFPIPDVAIVTGASRGVGRGVAAALHDWEQPLWRWDAMITTGVRSAFVASQLAARMMVPARRGLIANISHWAAQKHIGNTVYGIAKAATDKLTNDTALELRPHGVAVVSLYPGLVRTEAVLGAGVFDLSNSESPEFVGRAVHALSTDPALLELSGEILVAADLSRRYGFTDVGGKTPRPLTLGDV